jgi:hypothetical protein
LSASLLSSSSVAGLGLGAVVGPRRRRRLSPSARSSIPAAAPLSPSFLSPAAPAAVSVVLAATSVAGVSSPPRSSTTTRTMATMLSRPMPPISAYMILLGPPEDVPLLGKSTAGPASNELAPKLGRSSTLPVPALELPPLSLR